MQYTYKSVELLIISLSEHIVTMAKRCIAVNGRYNLALSGGNTPKLLYQYLVKNYQKMAVDWSKVYIYFGDERYVSHHDSRSNYKMSVDYLLNYLPIPKSNIYPVETTFQQPEESALHYEKLLLATISKKKNGIPVFDLILLGIGDDGHTASLFPGTDSLYEKNHLVTTSYHSLTDTNRVTFTFPLINAAQAVFVMVVGKSKCQLICELNHLEQQNIIKYPIQQLQPNGEYVWFVDSDADSC